MKRKHRWWIQYVFLLLVTALYYDWCFSASGDYAMLARNSDGYGVVDLNSAKADSTGKIDMDNLQVGSLTVTGSANLPASGTVPIHPIAGSHDTSATGAQLDTLVGGSASEAASLHNHASSVGNFTVGGSFYNNSSLVSAWGVLSRLGFSGATSATEYSTLSGRIGEHGVCSSAAAINLSFDDNAASSKVTDATGHWPAVLSKYGDYSVRYNTSDYTTTTAVFGGRGFISKTSGGVTPVATYLAGSSVSPFWNILAKESQDFTFSVWHCPYKTSTGSTEYLFYNSGGGPYVAYLTSNRYRFSVQPIGGSSFYINSAVSARNVFHLITFTRKDSAISFFVDGVLAGSNSTATNVGAFYGNLRLGTAPGVYDDMRVYRYALTLPQIKALYSAASASVSPKAAIPTVLDGSVGLPSRVGYVAEFTNEGGSATYKGIKVQAGENTATANNEMLGCYEADGDQRGAIVIDSGRNVAIWNVSDREVKTGLVETSRDVLGTLGRVRVYDYRLRDAGTPGFGFVAQEVADAAPGSGGFLEVQEMRDTSTTLGVLASDNGTTLTLADGSCFAKSDSSIKIVGTRVVRYDRVPVRVMRQGVIQTALIPYLWKIAQLQQAQITALKARVTLLETKVSSRQ